MLHAPRQTGKTSVLLALRDLLNSGTEGDYRCVYANVEAAQAAREDTETAMRAILDEMASWARSTLGDETLAEVWPGVLAESGPHGALREVLSRWSEADPRPLILLIDEIDALVGDTLLSVLRQLRAGYVRRPKSFPQSVVLCGVRDVRDYRIHSSSEKEIVAGGSAFNVKAESLRLGDFSEAEVRALLAQHAEETGQAFTEDALAEVWALTCGQPWLVNALAYDACFRNRAGRDRSRAIDAAAITEARERLIARRRRTDLLIVWPQGGRTRKFVIECKVLHKSLERTIGDGLEQTAAYMDRCAAESGHLIIFDRDESRSWEDKLFHRRESAGGVEIEVWGM